MTSHPTTPAFCQAPTRIWPFQVNLPEIVLVNTSFDESQFLFDDFAKVGITAPPSIHKSVRKRRAEFLAGRICAMEATRILGRSDPAPGIGVNREPLWHEPVIGSITHNDNCAAAAVSQSKSYRGIGIDYETEIPESIRKNIIHEILTPQELTLYHSLPERDRAQFFTLAFSLKESFFKAAFKSVGFYFDFQTLCVANVNSHRGTATLTIVSALSKAFPEGSNYEGLFFCTTTVVGTLVVI